MIAKKNTTSQCPGYDKKSTFFNKMDLCIGSSRGKNLNQEKMHVSNDIEMSESLSIVHEQQKLTEETAIKHVLHERVIMVC